MTIITDGYGYDSKIITEGYGSSWRTRVWKFISCVAKRISFISKVTQ